MLCVVAVRSAGPSCRSLTMRSTELKWLSKGGSKGISNLADQSELGDPTALSAMCIVCVEVC